MDRKFDLGEAVRQMIEACTKEETHQHNRVSQLRGTSIIALLGEVAMEMHRASFFVPGEKAVDLRAMAGEIDVMVSKIQKLM